MSFEQPSGVPQFQQPQFPRTAATNGFAITSMVMGILGFFVLYGLGSIFALVFGYIAKSQIKNSPTPQEGSGYATAGIVMGWIGIALGILLVVVIILLAAARSDFFGDFFGDFYTEVDAESLAF